MKNYIKYLNTLANSEIIQKKYLRCLFRFILVNFKFRIFRVRTFKWIDNLTLTLSSHDGGLLNNLYIGFAELELLYAFKFANSSHKLIDIGASSGEYSILLSGLKNIKSFAFEPSSIAYNRFILNLKNNKLEKLVSVSKAALGSINKTSFLTNNQDLMNFVSENGGENTEKIEIVTLDNFLINLNSDSKFIMKLDVEGYEYEVIKGATTLLNSGKVDLLILETNNSGLKFGFSDLAIVQLLSEYGYQPFSLSYINNRFEFEEGVKSNGNTLFAKQKSILESANSQKALNYCLPLNKFI